MTVRKASKTKIVATMGPASIGKDTLRQLILAGVDVCRLNFSHGKYEEYAAIIRTILELNAELGTHVAILADLQGPKLRVGEMENNGVMLQNGALFKLVSHKCIGTAEQAYMSYEPLPRDVNPGETILLDDGKLKLEVVETNRVDTVTTKVISGGILSSKKGVNLPNTNISLPSLTEKDLADAAFLMDYPIDWIALSFVRTANDIIELKEFIKRHKHHARVIAKIEKPEALDEIDNIIDLTDGIMVARGDLGVETPFDKVPVVQKQIVHKCILKAKPVIIATQMMESMITNFRPTRAEATDVANAVIEGADALMLSGETSVGNYPVEVIHSMQKVITSTEGHGFEINHDHLPELSVPSLIPESICYNASRMAELSGAKGIVVFSYSGSSVLQIAATRPKCTIYNFTWSQHLLTQLNLVRGVESFYLEPQDSLAKATKHSMQVLKEKGFVSSGDLLIFVGGIPMKERVRTNMMQMGAVE